MSKMRDILDNAGAALTILLLIMVSPLARRWYTRWGATDDELKMLLPGDELTRRPRLVYTRAITIRAAPEQVWPWLVQLGYGKGGLYSYELLENLIGCDLHNADRIVPEFQQMKVDDLIRLGPKGYPLFRVIGLEPNRYLLTAGADPKTEVAGVYTDPMPASYAISHQVYFLNRQADGSTRLILRSRMEYDDGFASRLIWRVFTEPIGFVMERKQMLGIKGRVEDARLTEGRPSFAASR